MEKTKKLIIRRTPLNGYMEDAFPLSVAVTSSQNYEWIYSNYIQLIFQDPKRFDNQPVKFFKLSCRTGYVWDAECPLLNYDKVTRNTIALLGINIIDFICSAIEQNCYVLIYLDEYFLSYRSQFRKLHYIHESLIVGFDLDKKIFYGLAYVTDKYGYSFKEFTVEMDEVIQAYQGEYYEGVQKERITLLSCNKEKFYEFDIEAVKNEVYDYLNSISSDEKYRLIINPNENYTFGIAVYDKLIKYYRDGSTQNTIIPLHIMYEHKVLMLERIMFMIENNYISYENSLVDAINKIITDCDLCKKIYMKYSIVKKEKLLQNMIDRIYRIKEEDLEFMQEFYGLLNHNTKCRDYESLYSRNGFWFDISYNLNETLTDTFAITFQINIINNKSKGYIKLSNKDAEAKYIAPITLLIDTENERFGIVNKEQKILLENIKCTANNIYKVRFLVDLNQRIYSLEIKSNDKLIKYTNIQFRENDELKYVDKIIVIHENSYRYAISRLNQIEDANFLVSSKD